MQASQSKRITRAAEFAIDDGHTAVPGASKENCTVLPRGVYLQLMSTARKTLQVSRTLQTSVSVTLAAHWIPFQKGWRTPAKA